ncbi:MAG: hypothetical protein WA104_03545 [Thermodesulfovibrionales bacterium]
MQRRKKPIILVSEAGGVLTRNFIDSLALCDEKYEFVGISSNPYELELSGLKCKYLVPRATDPKFIPLLRRIINKHKPDLFHSQHDMVIKVVSEHREMLGVKCFLPTREAIRNCVNKFFSNKIWSDAGLKVPKSMMLNNYGDLKKAFKELKKPLWLRANEGGGGYGALRADSLEFAKQWIDYFNGWGIFSISEYIGRDSTTWSSIWYQGELIVAQGRKRLGWLFADRTLSGVTGITGVGMTFADNDIDSQAIGAIKAIDKCPHGIFSVDFTLDKNGDSFLTEINIGRFFTTHNFFAHAGLNMAKIYVDLALTGKTIDINKKLNPLPNNLLWIRGMDIAPKLVSLSKIRRTENYLAREIKKIR